MAKPNAKQMLNRALAMKAVIKEFGPSKTWPENNPKYAEFEARLLKWTNEAKHVPKRQRDYIQSVLVQDRAVRERAMSRNPPRNVGKAPLKPLKPVLPCQSTTQPENALATQG